MRKHPITVPNLLATVATALGVDPADTAHHRRAVPAR